jgi:flagellar motility protein MotE (MotC chaperone)
MNRHSQLLTMVGGIVGSTVLFWVMVQLGQASSEPKDRTQVAATSGLKQSTPLEGKEVESAGAESDADAKLLAPPAVQGPAIDAPREVLDMLDQRKRDLDRREQALRQNEERLMIVRGQIEELLDQNEALEKKIQNAQAKDVPQQAKALAEKDRIVQGQRTQLAKIYESMPSEDAASRLEHMPDRKAIEILKLVKAKTAGAILAQVKADRAAKLTEQLLTQTP